MDFQHEMDLLLRSRCSLICVVTHEEERVGEELTHLAEKKQLNLVRWDHADDYTVLRGSLSVPRARDPLTALETALKLAPPTLVLLRDFHQCWHNQPRVIRKLRTVAQEFKYTRNNLVITMPTRELPVELEDESVRLDLPSPTYWELYELLKTLLRAPGVKYQLDGEDVDRLLNAALGLTSNQARRVFAKAIVSDGCLDADDVQLINAEKKIILAESKALEFFSPTETVNDVGGLDALKEWVRLRTQAHSQAAREYGLPPPKGIALIGIPGTGKSLSAKVIAGLWKLPLLRLDIGALFGSLVGQSEENTRKALQLAETVAPCVLWIDEIEKGLSTGGLDGGTSMRVLGNLLSWMQDKVRPVFVIATANDISRLPPELLRRGRFDEVFFLDLPNRAERREIFEVHLRRRGRDAEGYDLEALAAAAEGYVGAEIEQAVIDAMYLAFNDPAAERREFTTQDVLTALHRLVPLSRSQRERIDLLRQWLVEGRANSASRPETAAEPARDISLPLDVPGSGPAPREDA